MKSTKNYLENKKKKWKTAYINHNMKNATIDHLISTLTFLFSFKSVNLLIKWVSYKSSNWPKPVLLQFTTKRKSNNTVNLKLLYMRMKM